MKPNVQGALTVPAGSTATITSADIVNPDCRGVKVVLNMTVVGTGSVTLTIQGKDVASGSYFTLLAGAAVVGNGQNVYTVYPTGIAAVANVTAVDALPERWRIVVTANNANAATYTVGWSTLV